MKFLNKAKSIFPPLVIFYILVFYIFSTLIWWSFLLVKRNNQVYVYQQEIYKHKLEHLESSNNEFLKNNLINDIEKERKKQNRMIYLEASVFFILLIFGTVKINASFRKEIQLNRQQRNFLLSITHELKSPLAGIKISVETLKNRILGEKDKAMMMNNALADTDRLSNLISNLLIAAQLDSEDFQLGKQQLNISNIVNINGKTFKASFAQKRNININVKPDLFVIGDNTALNVIVSNLLENAIKYSAIDSIIEISLTSNKDKIILQVKDEGVGISDEEKGKIFTKFYRVGSEKTRKTKGTGLGLFIVKQLSQKQKAKISVIDNAPKGSVFEIIFNKV